MVAMQEIIISVYGRARVHSAPTIRVSVGFEPNEPTIPPTYTEPNRIRASVKPNSANELGT
jgi:hypothetical protein